MKFRQFHRIIQENGWIKIRSSGSHIIYEKMVKDIRCPFMGQVKSLKA